MPPELAEAFLARLWELQAEQGLSGSALARDLGVSPGYISRMKRGARGHRLSLNFAHRATQRFPELALFLTSDLPIITDRAIISSAPEEETEQ